MKEEKDHSEQVPAQEQFTRRQFLKVTAILAGGAAASSLLASCGAEATPDAPDATTAPIAAPTEELAATGPQSGGEMVFALAGDVSSLAPFGILLGLAHEGKELGYDSLVEYDKDLNVLPALAESWENPDATTWIFHLRQGVKFHDGKEMTADDVVYSLTLGMDASSVDPTASSVAGFAPAIDSVEAVDQYTVRITTPQPDATLLGWFAWARWSVIASENIYEEYNPSVQINGTGPFKLVEYVQNDQLVFEKNPDFWKPDLPYLDRITLKIIPDESAQIAALRAGQIDGCAVTSYDIARPLENDPNVDIYTGITGQTRVLQISVKNDGKPWDDIRVRQAVSMALNRDEIIEKVYGGQGEITAAVPPGWGGYALPAEELAANPYLQYNPDEARRLLADAGYEDGFDVEVITVQSADYVPLGEVIAEQLANVGIRANLNVLEAAQHSAAYREGNYEFFVNAQGFRRDPVGKLDQYGAPDAAPQSFWYNYPNGWQNERMTELYNQAITTIDPEERVPIVQELQRMGLEESTFVFLCVPYRINLMRSRVQNWFIDFMDFHKALRTAWVNDA